MFSRGAFYYSYYFVYTKSYTFYILGNILFINFPEEKVMTWLKIYEKEVKEFSEFQGWVIPKNEIKRIIYRLSKYFKVEKPGVKYHTRNYSYCDIEEKLLYFPAKRPTELIDVLHEFAHWLVVYTFCKETIHRGKFWDCLCKVYRVARTKQYLKKCKDKDEERIRRYKELLDE